MTKPVRHWLRFTLRVTERFFAAFGLCALIYHTCLDFTVVVSGSMSPTLQGNDTTTGDRVLFEKLTRRFRVPHRWEIHQFRTSDGLLVAKRIVGLPGERVSLRDGKLCINGNPIAIPAHLASLRYFPYGNLAGNNEEDCKTGYYVLGDDSRDSQDSRYEGLIAPESFTGRAWLILGPTEHLGFVR